MGMLRVCFVCFAAYPDQGATYAYEMSQSVAAAGHEVTAIAIRRPNEPREEVRGGVKVLRLDAPLTTNWMSASRWAAKLNFFRSAARVIRSGRFDVVHVYCTLGAFLLPFMGGRRPLWIQEHQTGAVSARTGAVRRLEDRLRALQGRCFNMNLTVTDALGQRLFGDRLPFEEMPAGVNLRLFHTGLSRTARHERGIPPGDVVFIHSGVLEAMRGTDVPVRAFARAVRINPRLWLWMPGKGSQLEELRALARELGVESRVWLPGYVPYETLPHLFAGADAGLSYLPDVGYYQGQPPMKVMEYLAAGLPVLATDMGSHRMRIQHGENGLLALPSEEPFARMLLEFAADAALRARLTANAAPSVRHLAYDAIATDRLIPTYRRLLARPA